jgi:hypothetical protein
MEFLPVAVSCDPPTSVFGERSRPVQPMSPKFCEWECYSIAKERSSNDRNLLLGCIPPSPLPKGQQELPLALDTHFVLLRIADENVFVVALLQ